MELKELFTKHRQAGIVSWIGIRPERKAAIKSVPEISAIESQGLDGDHYASPGGTRQVTLIQEEHLEAVASFLGVHEIDPQNTRRNVLVRGINLLGLKDQKFKVGEAIFEYTGECHPCSRMEENLGEGGYNAMRGHGGITAKIIKGGLIKLGDPVILLFD
jgi:MOSC domain-containing protein YiiM